MPNPISVIESLTKEEEKEVNLEGSFQIKKKYTGKTQRKINWTVLYIIYIERVINAWFKFWRNKICLANPGQSEIKDVASNDFKSDTG